MDDKKALHTEAVEKLWKDVAERKNKRVPVYFMTDEAVWLQVTGNTFREFYLDPRIQLHVQVAGHKWLMDNIVHDLRLGPPKTPWPVTPRFWMDEPAYFGCEVTLQENDFAWAKPMQESKQDLIQRISDIEPRERVKQSHLWKLYTAMKDMSEEPEIRDLPATVHFPAGTLGILSVACHVRGVEQLCMDMADDPDFVHEFLNLITEKIIERIYTWHKLAETGITLPSTQGWGMPDDDLQLISREMCERFVIPCHEKIYAAMTTSDRQIHLCGHAEHQFQLLYDRLGLSILDGPGMFVDHGKVLAQMPKLSLVAQTNHTILALGPISEIDEMMKNLLNSSAKQPGRIQVMGFLMKQTPLEHVKAMYEAGLKYGQIT